MANLIGIFGIIILFVIGLAFLIPGIVGTIITSKAKLGPKAPRVLSIISLILGIVLCALPFLIGAIAIVAQLLGVS